MRDEEVVLIVFGLITFAGVGLLFMAMSNRRALREMEHRERLAMIQKGLIPAPEADPFGFEAATTPMEWGSPRSERWRSAGIFAIGIGLALMMLLSFTVGDPSIGIGVGGAFAVLGLTLLFNSSQLSRFEPQRRMPPYPPPRPPYGPPPQHPPDSTPR